MRAVWPAAWPAGTVGYGGADGGRDDFPDVAVGSPDALLPAKVCGTFCAHFKGALDSLIQPAVPGSAVLPGIGQPGISGKQLWGR